MPYKLAEDKRSYMGRYQQTTNGKQAAARAISKRSQRIKRIGNALKQTLGCTDRGYNANPDALNYDHDIPLRNSKMRRVTNMTTYTGFWSAVLDSNVKVRCCNCHAIKSRKEQRA